jgi:ATP/maltotriose-dependent transcriptional regulator MalT
MDARSELNHTLLGSRFANHRLTWLRSLYWTNLPVPATSFLGRERDLAEVVSLLEADDSRLVTLVGPSGTGKTRLALQAAAEVAERFPDGVWWVPLAPVRDPTLVFSTVAAALELREEPGRELADTLADRLEVALAEMAAAQYPHRRLPRSSRRPRLPVG